MQMDRELGEIVQTELAATLPEKHRIMVSVWYTNVWLFFLIPLRSVQIWEESRPICRVYAFFKH